MDPQLRLLLRPDANLVAFQSKYTVFPSKSSGKAVFRFVFEMPDSSPQDWPETTSLERALKKHYLSGHYIYEPGGFFFPSAIEPADRLPFSPGLLLRYNGKNQMTGAP